MSKKSEQDEPQDEKNPVAQRAIFAESLADSAIESDDLVLRTNDGLRDVRPLNFILEFIIAIGIIIFAFGVVDFVAMFQEKVLGTEKFNFWTYLISTLVFVGITEITRIRNANVPFIALATILTISAGSIFSIPLWNAESCCEEYMTMLIFGFEDNAAITTCIAAALTGLLLYIRYKKPFAWFLIATHLASLVFLTIMLSDWKYNLLLIALIGLTSVIATLAVAVWFDLKESDRKSFEGEKTFWIYASGAYQLLFLTGYFMMQLNAITANEQGWIIPAIWFDVLLIFALFGLATNRRFLALGALISQIVAVYFLFEHFEMSQSATALYFGMVVLFGAFGWKPARRLFLKILPNSGQLKNLFVLERS